MAIQVNKDTMSGIRAMLKYSVIRYSVAAAIVIGVLFGGLYLIKDSAIVDAFKRDDAQLNAIKSELEVQTRLMRERDSAQNLYRKQVIEELKQVKSLSAISIIFNKDVPADKRLEAFKIAREMGLNHGIRRQYVEFLNRYPDAAWQDKTPQPVPQGRMVTNEHGISYEVYE